MRRVLSLIAVVLVLLAQRGDAQQLTLAWDPSPAGTDEASTAVGYVVHVGTESGVYPEAVLVGDALSWTRSVVYGQRYYFAVAALNAANAMGPLSSEVSGVVEDPAPPPPPPPADTIAPSVSISVGRNGKSANYSVTATAIDNVGVTSFRLFSNDVAFLACTQSPCSATVKLGKGAYTFTAIATDAAGNIGQASQTITN